jgi:hypothetical protein
MKIYKKSKFEKLCKNIRGKVNAANGNSLDALVEYHAQRQSSLLPSERSEGGIE